MMIDVDRLRIYADYYSGSLNGEKLLTLHMLELIIQTWAVDAEEVVRCNDCYYHDGTYCHRYVDETGCEHSTQPNFYCSVAQRRGESE